VHKTSVQHFFLFFWNADSVRVVSSSSGCEQAELYRVHYMHLWSDNRVDVV